MIRGLLHLHVRRSRGFIASTLAAAVLFALAGAAIVASPVGDSIEQRTADARVRDQYAAIPPDDVVMLELDDTRDITSSGFSWPMPLAMWNNMVETLAANEPAVIVFDLPFDTTIASDSDVAAFRRTVREAQEAGVEIVFAAPAPGDEAHTGDPAAWIEAFADDAEKPLADLGGARLGRRSVPHGDESLLRYDWDGGDGVPSLAEQAVRAAGIELEKPPASGSGLHWYGSVGGLPSAPLASVVSPGLAEFSPENAATNASIAIDIDSRIVVVGRTDGPSRDPVRTSLSAEHPQVEVEATAIANLIDGSWLREAPAWSAWAAGAGLALLCWTLLVLTPVWIGVPLALAANVGWGWFAWHQWFEGVMVPMVLPLGIGGFVYLGLTIGLSVAAVRERLRVKGLFARYVSPDVVSELLDQSDTIRMGGEERVITVLFSDIRGFTTMSEHVDPAEMVEQLNEYFAEMVEVVTEHRGTLDKFLGDGLMAIFGAPVDQPDHAEQASRAALEMLRRLDELNARRAERGLAPLEIGIGLHTGRAVVGNVGSPLFRVDFTAIGDTVNLAARLESATKDVGARIVASGDTVAAVEEHGNGDGLSFIGRGRLMVKGRGEAVDAWELLEPGDAAAIAPRADEDVPPLAS